MPISNLKTGNTRSRVAYLGPEGTFSEQAARKEFSGLKVTYLALPAIQDVFEAVSLGKVSCGVVPVENSLEGSVNITLDLLYGKNLKIRGEIKERIKHNLIAKPNARKSDLRVILSHQQALAQCRGFIERNFPKAVIKEAASTALAVKQLRRLRDAAAIGTELAARIYGMKTLARDVGDNPNNFTRFLVIGRTDSKPTGRDKTSVIFTTKHVPGALFKALEPFASRNINLSKIESRPSRGKPWEYVFFTEFEGHRTEPKCREALISLRRRCEFLKILGSYPRVI